MALLTGRPGPEVGDPVIGWTFPHGAQRKKSGAFQADPALVAGKEILLLDDVVTTGATFAACSEALNNAGAKYIYALTLARALPHHGLQIV